MITHSAPAFSAVIVAVPPFGLPDSPCRKAFSTDGCTDRGTARELTFARQILPTRAFSEMVDYQVGAIHGRLLTAWSTAGVLGPVIVNAIADARIEAGVAGPGRYTLSFTIMVGLLVVGFVCNELIKPVSERYHEQALDKTGTRTEART
jgi:hypothetical protein